MRFQKRLWIAVGLLVVILIAVSLMKTTEGFDAIQMWLDAILKRQQQVVQALNPSESQVQ